MERNNHNEHPNILGLKFWKQGKLLEAEKCFLKAIKQSPNGSAGYCFLVSLYIEKHEFDQARTVLEIRQRKFPHLRASYHIELAKIFSLERDKENALFHLKAALDANFDNNEMILKDPRLGYVRGTPEFRQLMMIKR